MEQQELIHAIEAVIFATGDPLSLDELKKIFDRYYSEAGHDQEQRKALLAKLRPAVQELQRLWPEGESTRGFALRQVAGGYAFRSNSRYAPLLQAMRQRKTMRLSRAAMETLTIIAYRQPLTKAEADHIRGVDCSGTLKVLLEHELIRIVGKKDEPGRPLLYGTTRAFLDYFNLAGLEQLPALRDVQELTEESEDALRQEGFSMESLLSEGTALQLDDTPAAVQALDEAVAKLSVKSAAACDAFAEAGVRLNDQSQSLYHDS